MDHIRGFKKYLEVAEGEELKRMKAPPPPLTPQLFESYLPAALALGVEQRWAERFADVLDVQAPNYSPAWYAGRGWNSRDLGGILARPRLVARQRHLLVGHARPGRDRAAAAAGRRAAAVEAVGAAAGSRALVKLIEVGVPAEAGHSIFMPPVAMA